MKHIFLTGEIQIGKSTVIQRTLQLLKRPHGGFSTYFGPNRGKSNRCLYIGDARLPFNFDDDSAVARFAGALPPEVYPERFDTLGTRYIEKAAEDTGLIIMDECGNLENRAVHFQGAILNALEGHSPILGVVKLSATGWVDRIRNHPNVVLLTVDKQNRDTLPALLYESLR